MKDRFIEIMLKLLIVVMVVILITKLTINIKNMNSIIRGLNSLSDSEEIMNNVDRQMHEKDHKFEQVDEEEFLDKQIREFFSALKMSADDNVDVIKVNSIHNAEDRVERKRELAKAYMNYGVLISRRNKRKNVFCIFILFLLSNMIHDFILSSQ